MKIIYIDELELETLNKEIDLKKYLIENKLVILSKYPYIIDAHLDFKNRLPKINNNSILYTALGNLAFSNENNYE